MHAGGRTWRRCARRALVVGTGRRERVRHSLLARGQSRAQAGHSAERNSRGEARLTPQPLTHQGFTLWFTGLSGAGKSTISGIIEKRLREAGAKIEMLDGDVVRENLSKGLGFSKEDRDINIRRIGFVCELLSRNGVIAIVAAISPYRAVRDEIRQRVSNFVEVFVECPLD